MNKQFTIIIATLLIILTLTVYFSFIWTNHDKKQLETAFISKVTICKALPFCDSTILLTKQQIDDFALKWNSSTDVGYNKYQCQYYIEVYLSDDKKRTFCTSQDQIMEGSTNGWMYSINQKTYFDSIYQINIGTLNKHLKDKEN
jgi:hypothetical protein